MIYNIWSWKKRQVLTIKSLLCKIALIDSNGYPPPSWWHGFSWKCTLLRFTTHCALPCFSCCNTCSVVHEMHYLFRTRQQRGIQNSFRCDIDPGLGCFFKDQSSAVYNMTLRLEFVFKLNYKIHLYALRTLVWL